MKTKLRREIEEIVFSEAFGDEKTDRLLSLFKKTMKEIIGEKEYFAMEKEDFTIKGNKMKKRKIKDTKAKEESTRTICRFCGRQTEHKKGCEENRDFYLQGFKEGYSLAIQKINEETLRVLLENL